MSVAVTSGKVALLDYKTIASDRSKSAVPKTLADATSLHIDCGTTCDTVFNALK
jgi:hypothetical protein